MATAKDRYENANITPRDVEVLKQLMSGKHMRFAVKPGKETEKAIGTNSYWHMGKLLAKGIVVGFVPVLSEEGRKVIDAMEMLSKMGKGKSEDCLTEVFEKD